MIKHWIIAIGALNLTAQHGLAQTGVDDERMKRDIEVAENVLATLIKQELQQGRAFFGLDVKGTYQPGYGVTFRVPLDHSMPLFVNFLPPEPPGPVIAHDGYHYSIRVGRDDQRREGEADTEEREEEEDMLNRKREAEDQKDKAGLALKDKSRERKKQRADSARASYNESVIRAAQNFILDYGDFLSQLGPNDKIVVTNQSDRPHHFYFNRGNHTRISVEGSRADVTAFRQGKLSREQALKKLTIINTESVDVKEPDMEMLSSIFSRLYRPDLSKTYFSEGNVYYERLKDFGTIFYMEMVSSIENAPGRFTIPTLGLAGLDQATRDKEVTQLYPAFEKDIKENILEYGRTLKSLEPDENLIFNITLTKCKGCGIPSTLEVAIKASVLQDFAAGKIDKAAAMAKFTVKKGAIQ